MKRSPLMIAAVALLLAGVLWLVPRGGNRPDPATLGPPGDAEVIVAVAVPEALSAEARMGERAFAAKCAVCHGVNAGGRAGVGPPLVHRVYEPGHHGDVAFELAVSRGVPSHHWDYGSMPPVDGLTRADIRTIVAYVRELQRENGVR